MLQLRTATMDDYEGCYALIYQNQNEDVRNHFNDEKDVETKLILPLQLEQAIVGVDESGKIVGLCTVAFMSPEDARKYVQDPEQDMEPQYWNSGDEAWVILLVADPAYSQEFLQKLSSEVGPSLGRDVKFMRGDRVYQMDFAAQGQQMPAAAEQAAPYDMGMIAANMGQTNV